MNVRVVLCCVLVSFALVLTACVAAGPPLGLGPVLDQIVGLIIVAGLILAGLWAFRVAVHSSKGQTIGRQDSETARDSLHGRVGRHDSKREGADQFSWRPEVTLRQRYARGEIDRKQYLEMLDDLK
jgi:uncharacterized membrane protein